MSDNITVKIIKNDGTEVVLTEEQWESEDNQYCDMESDSEYMVSEGISSLQFFKDDMPHGSLYEYFQVECGDDIYHYHYSEYKDGLLHGEYILRENETDGCIIEEANYVNGKRHGLHQEFTPGQYYDEEYGLNIKDETYKHGNLHSLNDKPAQIQYGHYKDYDTDVVKESWYKDGKLHRKNGPAVIYHYNPDEYSEDDFYCYIRIEPEYKEEYWIDGVQVDSPPEDTSKFQVRINGKGRKISLDKFNEEKEEFIKKGLERLEYYKNGKKHREDGPAEIYYNDDGSVWSEEWYLNGEKLSIEEFTNHLGVDHYKSETREVFLKDKKLHREDGPAKIEYHDGGSVYREEWYLNGKKLSIEKFANHLAVDHYKSETREVYLKDKKLHREDGPAVIDYRNDRSVRRESWYLNGEKHREDGAASVGYWDDGSIDEEYWYLNGEIVFKEVIENNLKDGHYKSKNKEVYLKNKKLHREDGPAVIEYNEDGSVKREEFYLDGKTYVPDFLLSDDSIQIQDGNCQRWVLKSSQSVVHREDGPAEIWSYQYGGIRLEAWYYLNKKHNKDGPAIVKYREDGTLLGKEYWIDGEELSEEEFKKRQNLT